MGPICLREGQCNEIITYHYDHCCSRCIWNLSAWDVAPHRHDLCAACSVKRTGV